MAITPIQIEATNERKLSGLEKVALALDIADKTMGMVLRPMQYMREGEREKEAQAHQNSMETMQMMGLGFQRDRDIANAAQEKEQSDINAELSRRLRKIQEATLAETTRHNKAMEALANVKKSIDVKDESSLKNGIERATGMLRGATSTGQAKIRYQSAQNALRILNLINNEQDPQKQVKMTREMSTEFAMNLVRLMSGNGQAGIETFREIRYDTLPGNLKHLWQYLSGQPQNYLSDALKKQYGHTLNAEKTFWHSQLMNDINAQKYILQPTFDRHKADIDSNGMNYEERFDAAIESSLKSHDTPQLAESSNKGKLLEELGALKEELNRRKGQPR